ncbi:hypothetical protein H7I87_18385 [Mycobacterium timonense]|nr:hypothetical protein [Mycobacterium bouchedurhonense]MCV6996651.1 hypothetical protein [Mycobacterium timonense]
MATNLVGWFGKGGAETEATAGSLTTTKVLIAIEVAAAEAIIAAKESEIAALQATSLRPEIRERRIQQLRNEIQQTINEAKRDIEALYNGLYTPTTPAPLGLTPLVFKGSPPVGSGNGTNRHGGESGPGAPGGGVKASPVDSNGSPAEKPQYDETAPSNQKPSTEPAQNTAKSDEVTKPQSQASGQLQPGQSETRVVPQKSGQLGTNGAGVAPQPPTSIGASTPGSGAGSGLSGVGGGVPKMAGLSPPSSPLPTSGLSGGGLPAGGSGLAGSGLPSSGSIPGGGAAGSPAAAPPPAQFLSGAAQGFASSAPVTSSAAAAQPFRPPPGSTMPAGPPPAVPSSPPPSAVGEQVVPAQSGASPPPISPQQAAAVPLAPPPAAGVPNPPAPPPAPPAAPSVAGPVGVPGSGGSGAPPTMPPPSVMNLGATNAALRAVRMGSHTIGGGLSATPEFAAATALVAALNDPALGWVQEWACAVFKQAGEKARFVIASREGLSWIPSGVYMPGGVIIAHLDDTIDWSIRKLWRGLKPPARVLAQYAHVIGEAPILVVARHRLGLAALFAKHTVIVADDKAVVDHNHNPLRNPAGRHRLQVASPDDGWPWVQAIPEDKIAATMRYVASWVAESHDRAFGVDGLRGTTVQQISRSGGDELWAAVGMKMHKQRSEIMTSGKYDAPEPLAEGWNKELVAAEQQLRGWETLWLAQREPTRETLADMVYSALAATR